MLKGPGTLQQDPSRSPQQQLAASHTLSSTANKDAAMLVLPSPAWPDPCHTGPEGMFQELCRMACAMFRVLLFCFRLKLPAVLNGSRPSSRQRSPARLWALRCDVANAAGSTTTIKGLWLACRLGCELSSTRSRISLMFCFEGLTVSLSVAVPVFTS